MGTNYIKGEYYIHDGCLSLMFSDSSEVIDPDYTVIKELCLK